MKFIKFIVKFTFFSLIFITCLLIGLYIYALSLPKININNINNVTILDDNDEIIFLLI